MTIADPAHWKEPFQDKGDKYDKIVEIIAALNGQAMIGSANSAWVPCIFSTGNVTSTARNFKDDIHSITNLGGTDGYAVFWCPLPTNRGGLSLYIKGVRVEVLDADANDYVTTMLCRKVDSSSSQDVAVDTTDRTSSGTYDTTFTAVDVSDKSSVVIGLQCILATAGELNLPAPQVDAYYA